MCRVYNLPSTVHVQSHLIFTFNSRVNFVIFIIILLLSSLKRREQRTWEGEKLFLDDGVRMCWKGHLNFPYLLPKAKHVFNK